MRCFNGMGFGFRRGRVRFSLRPGGVKQVLFCLHVEFVCDFLVSVFLFTRFGFLVIWVSVDGVEDFEVFKVEVCGCV